MVHAAIRDPRDRLCSRIKMNHYTLFFAEVIPHIKFHPNRMKNTEVPIFEILNPANFF